MLKAQVLELMLEHADRYPDMDTVDLYKLLHQAVMGAEHAVVSPDIAREALFGEAAELELAESFDWEEPVEVLDADRSLARVHLRPFLRAGGDMRRLADAFVATSEEFDEDVTGLKTTLGLALRLLESEAEALDLGFEKVDFSQFLGEAAKAGYRAFPHSEMYRETYKPAYRLILLDKLQT